MKLVDLRKLAIRKQIRIRFRLRNGMECVITEHGVSQVPGWHGVPDFNLEEELAQAASFLLDPVAARAKGAPEGKPVPREELAGMTAGGASAEAPSHEDD